MQLKQTPERGMLQIGRCVQLDIHSRESWHRSRTWEKKCNNTKTIHSLFYPCPLSAPQFGPVNIGVSETQKHCLLESHFSKCFFGFVLLFLSVNFSGIVFIKNNCKFHRKILLSLESTKEHLATSGSFGYISISFALAWSQEIKQMESFTETTTWSHCIPSSRGSYRSGHCGVRSDRKEWCVWTRGGLST